MGPFVLAFVSSGDEPPACVAPYTAPHGVPLHVGLVPGELDCDCQCAQPPTDPLGDVHRDGVADELPAVATLDDGRSRQRPVRLEALQSLGVADVGFHDRSARQHNRGRRGNADARPTLERRCRVASPAESAQPLGPVEAEGVVAVSGGRGLASVLTEQDGARVLGP